MRSINGSGSKRLFSPKVEAQYRESDRNLHTEHLHVARIIPTGESDGCSAVAQFPEGVVELAFSDGF